jgi:hypothetical protein
MVTPDEHQGEEYGEERSPWSKPSVMLSGMFVLALLLGGIAFLIFNGGKSTHHSHSAASVTSSPAGSVTAPATTGAAATTSCTLPAGNQRVPYNSPPQAQWGTVGSMQVPQNRQAYGPQRTNGVWNTCFAHSPSGALLAALNFWAESTAAPSGEVYRHLGVDVPSQAFKTTSRLDDEGPVQFAGYKYQSYSSSTAQVIVVIKGPRAALEAAGTSMQWTGSDWRYAFPPGGTPPLQTIPDLTGYVQWSSF